MKIPTLLIRKKKLRASTARRSLVAPDEMDFDEMSEPNMKLSRALLIVLVLHVVAVAGIIAFNTIKSRQASLPRPNPAADSAKVEAAPKTSLKNDSAIQTASLTQPATVRRDDVRPAIPLAKEDRSPVQSKASSAASAPPDSREYVVVKGDNPVSIAKKLKVSQGDLLALNHIDDPRKLRIGQKLVVPAAKKAKSKAESK